VKVYLNGVNVHSSIAVSNPGNPIAWLNHFIKVGQGNANESFIGKIDDIALWNRSLTPTEITNLYNSVNTPAPIVSVSPASTTICPGTPTTLTASTSGSTACSSSGLPTSLQTGLVGYWPFNGNANDESGNGNNGTNNGATLTTDRFGNLNSAYDYNGTNNNINFGSSTVFGLTSNNILTFSVWVRPLRASNNANIMDGVFSKYQDLNVSNCNYYFSIDKNVSSSSNPPNGVITANGTNSIGATCELNTWQHYVIVMQSGLNNIKVYRNGVLDNTGTVNFSSLISNSNLYLGYIPTTTTNITQSNFLGKIDDFSIWNRALTQQEITNLYNANQCLTNITVTDTLIINVGQLSFNDPVTWANNITISPNPASSQININFNNITNLNTSYKGITWQFCSIC
jgi:hypothetical protein